MSEKLFKVIIIGDPTVGKTSFVQRYVQDTYKRDYKGTVGVDFALKIIKWSESQTVKLQCDLAQRQVEQMDIETFYKDNNFIGWTETSAREGLMVNDSMRFLVEVMLKQSGLHNSTNDDEETLQLKAATPETSNCAC